MKPTRKTQPYRDMHGRPGTHALASMLRGRTAQGTNPQDAKRGVQKVHRRLNKRHLAGLLAKKR